jgi:hypothetical protein
MGPIELPANRLAPIARRTASNAKTVGAILMFFWALFLIAGIAMAFGDAESFGGRGADRSSTILGLVVWLGGLALVAHAYLKRAMRATTVAALATADKGHVFTIDGKDVFTADMVGVVQAQLTFRVSKASRAELVAIPQATVVVPR